MKSTTILHYTKSNKFVNVLAGFLLLLMLGLGFFSMRGDSATMDELAHTPAGYSYIVKQDMRLNPEHPPLLKDLAGLSVWLGSKITGFQINFPVQHKSWQEDINGQWDFGGEFFYKSGNDADKIIFWSRLPMLLIMLLLGFYVFKWAREIYGNKAGLIALFLYSLSPTFLAHGRLVTTDVGAAAAFFIATYYLVKWLQQPNKKNLIVAGLVFGLAMLTKFSLALLIPYFILLTLVWVIIQKKWKLLVGLLLIGLIGMALIWPVYLFHTWHYPAERQQTDTNFVLQSFGKRWLADPVVWMADKPVLRAYGQYFSGLLMVIQRATGGNTTYFLGEISAAGWPHYFPVVFAIKTPLAFLVLILISLLLFIPRIKLKKISLVELALFSFFVIYWITTLRSNLNIGVRHILPTFPILYILVSGQLIKIKKTIGWLLVAGLLIWYAFGTIKIYPHFLTYFNELAGGPGQGHQYVTDSNLDWGQDLKRLAQFVEENKINEIYVDYFGGGSIEYYLKEKYRPWWGDRDPAELPPNSWLAVSATFLQGGRGQPAPGYTKPTNYYNWLNQYEPVTTIGHSIFVYQR